MDVRHTMNRTRSIRQCQNGSCGGTLSVEGEGNGNGGPDGFMLYAGLGVLVLAIIWFAL